MSIAPILLAWAFVGRLAPRWAVPAAVVAAGAVIVVRGVPAAGAAPVVALISPTFDTAALVAIAVPLYLVTMTSQNLPGVGVLAGFGYRLDARGPLVYTGMATAAGALLGGHAINLAAISAALAAGPQAHPDRHRRWVAGLSCGIGYVLLGLASGWVIGIAHAAPPGLLGAVAGSPS